MAGTVDSFSYGKKKTFFLMQNIFNVPAMQHGCRASTRVEWRTVANGEGGGRRGKGGEGNSGKWQKFVIGTQYLAINLVVNVGWYFPAEKHWRLPWRKVFLFSPLEKLGYSCVFCFLDASDGLSWPECWEVKVTNSLNFCCLFGKVNTN